MNSVQDTAAHPHIIIRRFYIMGLLVVLIGVTGLYLESFFFQDRRPGEDTLLITAYGFFLCCSIFMLFNRKPYLFDPAVLLFAASLTGVTLKVPALLRHESELNRMLQDQPVEILTTGTLVILAGLTAFFVIYFLVVNRRNSEDRIAFEATWKHDMVLLTCGLLTGICAVSAILAMNEIGFASLLENFSSKRFLELEGASGRFGTSLYTFYKIAISAKILVYACLVYLLWARPSKRNTYIAFAIIFVGALISILIPIIFNSRGQAVLAMIDVFLILYFAGVRIRFRYMALMGVFTYAVLAITTIARIGWDRYTGVMDAIMLRRYVMDLTKTSQIVEHFSVNKNWFLGETLIGWIFVPIPQSILADKPLFADMGKWIGTNIYSYKITGVPPGYIGELFLNFGYTGLITGMAILGLVMGLFWIWFIKRVRNPVISVFGALVMVRFGMYLFNNDLGTFMIKNLIETLPVALLVFLFCQVKSESKRAWI